MHDGGHDALNALNPECTATCFIIVTIVEIHRLIIDVSVSK